MARFQPGRLGCQHEAFSQTKRARETEREREKQKERENAYS